MTVESVRTTGTRSPGPRIDELEALLDRSAALADAPPNEFIQGLLTSAARAASADGAAIWVALADGAWRPEFTLGTAAQDADRRTEAVRAAAAARSERVVPHNESPDAASVSILAPAADRVLELLVDSESADRHRRVLIEITRSFAEVAGHYFGGRELETLRQQSLWWRRLDAFAKAIHRPLDAAPTAYAIANEGRTAVGCDRLTVTTGRRCRVRAVSGVETFDRRSDAVRRLESLAAAVVSSKVERQRFRGDGPEGTASPRLTKAWDRYREAVAVDTVEAITLFDRVTRPGRAAPVGTLVAEWFTAPSPEPQDRLGTVAAHAELAVRNSLRATSGPVGRFARRLFVPLRLRHLPKTIVAAALIAAAVAALVLVEVDFDVAARGRLRPERSREIFAPRDGVVRTLDVRHGTNVTEGAPLLTLVDPTLDLELERVGGEIATAQQKLLAVQAERATAVDRSASGPPVRPGQLAGEEQELEELLASLERQLTILQNEQTRLVVRSPLDGTVLTWETAEQLESRPVRRGQRLLTVAQPEGDWILELFVSDRRIGHLLDARKADRPNLDIDYLLATDPKTTHHATLDTVAVSTEPDPDGEPSVRITARLARNDMPDPRPGATVVANVRCGRRPLWFVWFHEAYETFRTHVWF